MPITTAAKVKTAFDIDSTADDTRLADLISAVETMIEKRFGLTIAAASSSEDYNGNGTSVLVLRRFPTVSIADVWVSTDLPRVFDATTVLTADEDYILDADFGVLHRTDGLVFPRGPKTVRVSSSYGFSSVPADLERAAIETIGSKLFKSKDKLYHLTSESRGDGSITGIRWEDVPPDAKEVFESYDAGRRSS